MRHHRHEIAPQLAQFLLFGQRAAQPLLGSFELLIRPYEFAGAFRDALLKRCIELADFAFCSLVFGNVPRHGKKQSPLTEGDRCQHDIARGLAPIIATAQPLETKTALSRRDLYYLCALLAGELSITLALGRDIHRRNVAQGFPARRANLPGGCIVRIDESTNFRVEECHGVGAALKKRTKACLALTQRLFGSLAFFPRAERGHTKCQVIRQICVLLKSVLVEGGRISSVES